MGGAVLVHAAWAALIALAMAAEIGGVEVGVNWGTMASHPLNPNIVVRMLKDNGIKKVKLFDADSWTVSTLAGSNIEVMLGIPNDQLKKFAEDYDNAEDWVKENVTVHLYQGGVDIKYVCVGNEAFLTSYNGSFVNITLPAMQNIQKALAAAGLANKIKVSTPLNADVYESHSDKPSDGRFRPDIYDVMKGIVHFLHDNHSPFIVNIYPFLSLYQNPDFPVDFAFFDGGGRTVNDQGRTYTSVFDANYDTLVSALKKVGVPDLKIIVGEVGWPTDGHVKANIDLANRFYDGLFKKLANKEGTPLRPKEKLEVYLFGLLDEDTKSIQPGFFERHWGIFRYDGKPKFPMDITGKGNDKMPVAAKGVIYMEKKWCVLKNNVKDLNEVSPQIDYACSRSDCTSMVYGSSCNGLDRKGNISYAFNMYFQIQDQSVEACVFNGMAHIVTQNASQGTCLFPIQLESGADRLKLGAFLATAMAGLVWSLFVLV